jgi:PII-like signaling protein
MDMEGEMLTKGPAQKVTIFLNEDTQHHLTALHDSIMTFLMHKGVAGATATRAYAGFGSHQVLHTPDVDVLAQHLPIRIEFIDAKEKVDEVLPTLYEMVSDGLIEVQDTTVVKLARKGARSEAQAQGKVPHERKQGPAKLLRVFMGEADRLHDEPLYDAIVKRLIMMDIAGATVYRGILGYGAKGHQHKATFFHPVRDLPIMISVIDTAEKISAAAEVIEGMLQDGLIVTSDAEMVRLVRSSKATETIHATGLSS